MSYTCSSCHGKVSNATGRKLPDDTVREHHEAACPKRGRKMKEEPNE